MIDLGRMVVLFSLLAFTKAFAPTLKYHTVLSSTFVKRAFFFTRSSVSLQDKYSLMEGGRDKGVSRPEFAALSPGSEVEIQVGNLDLARKAWKKRRRSGSPLLVPCSILSTDRKSMVLNNLVFLLHKFGVPISELSMSERPSDFRSNQIGIASPDLSRFYRMHLKTSLKKHAKALHYSNAAELVNHMFTEQVEEEYGVKLVTEGDQSWLVAKISKMRGHRLTEQCAILQFLEGDADTMMHTGMTRHKSQDGPGVYDLAPLSAALRLGQRGLENISSGSTHRAVLVGVDPMGDGGSPLLKVALAGQGEMRKKNPSKYNKADVDDVEIEYELSELKAGDGPFIGKVVRVSSRSGAAFVDIGAGRTLKGRENDGKRVIRVLGMLRFDDLLKQSILSEANENTANPDVDLVKDMLNSMEYDDEENGESGDYVDDNIFADMTLDDLFIEDSDVNDQYEGEEGNDETEEEIVEDISHLVSIEDGVFTYTDPDSGEKIIMGSLNDDDEASAEIIDEEDDFFAGLSAEQRLEKLDEIMEVNQGEGSVHTLQVGDEVAVHIQAVSKQSGRFMLTTQSTVPSMKESKKETKANAHLSRLLEQFGGDIKNIEKLKGAEGKGIVKAVSKTGDWLYVQPQFQDLPVGVATLDDTASLELFSEGDVVQIRLDGIDKLRGQLAMTVLAKE